MKRLKLNEPKTKINLNVKSRTTLKYHFINLIHIKR